MLASLAGATLSIAQHNVFQQNMTAVWALSRWRWYIWRVARRAG